MPLFLMENHKCFKNNHCLSLFNECEKTTYCFLSGRGDFGIKPMRLGDSRKMFVILQYYKNVD